MRLMRWKGPKRRSGNIMITDFSGHNWDDDAMNILMDTVRFDSYFGGQPRPIRTVSANVLTDAQPELVKTLGAEVIEATTQSASDLSHADLHGADLSHADLRGANLTRANLTAARLDHANLEKADLRGADLRSAHLAAAKLREARLYGALFDKWTDLPFDKDSAIRRGMVYLEVLHNQ